MTVCPCAISKPVLTMFLKWKQETSELTVTPISWQWFGCVVFFFFFLWGFNPILQFTWHNPEGVIWYIWLPILPNTDEGENKKSATRTAGGRLICKQRGRIDESTQTRFRCSSWRRAHATAPEWLSPKKKIFFITHHQTVLFVWFVDRRMTSFNEEDLIFQSSSNNMLICVEQEHGWLFFSNDDIQRYLLLDWNLFKSEFSFTGIFLYMWCDAAWMELRVA